MIASKTKIRLTYGLGSIRRDSFCLDGKGYIVFKESGKREVSDIRKRNITNEEAKEIIESGNVVLEYISVNSIQRHIDMLEELKTKLKIELSR